MKQYVLIGMLLVAFLLRIVAVNSVPPILNRDEAAIGYNAYLLHETGKDEWEKSWPLGLESFGDYKLIGYPFLVSLLFNVFQPDDWVVRLPAVLAGVWLVYVVYAFALELGFKRMWSSVVAFLIATQPVFIYFSRMAWESMVGLSLFMTAVWLLFKKRSQRTWQYDSLAVVLLLLAMATYNTPLLLAPVLIVLLILRRGFVSVKNWIFPVLLISVAIVGMGLLLLPLTAQKKGITLVSDESTIIAYGTYRETLTSWQRMLIGSFPVYVLGLASKNFVNSFSYSFLVAKGGAHPWHTLPGWGHLYGLIYLFSMSGGVLLVLKLLKSIQKQFSQSLHDVKKWQEWLSSSNELQLFVLGVASLAPAVITVDAPHATRSLLFFVVLSFWAVYCLRALVRVVPKYQLVLLAFVCGVTVIQLCFYMNTYIFHYPVSQKVALQVGYLQALQQAQQKAQGEPIAVVDSQGYHYILTAWYLKMSPEEFKNTVVRQLPDSIGFRYGEKVGQFHFIAKAADHSETERVLVEWVDTGWQVKVL